MRQLFKGEFQQDAIYTPGSICKFGSVYRVLSRSREWVDIAAKPDDSDRGPAGPAGRDGARGSAGRDGAPAPLITPAGKWRAGKVYQPLSIVSHRGSSFLAVTEVRREPPGRGWQLLAKAGEDGKTIEHHSTRQIIKRTETLRPEPIRAVFDSNTSKGQVVYISGDGRVDLAQANGRPQTRAIGIALQDVSAGHAGEYMPVGPVSCETWNLMPGVVYYLDPSIPGGITSVYPTTSGQFVVVLGVATTANQLNLSIHYLLEQS